MGFLRTIIIIVGLYYVSKFLLTYILPFFVKVFFLKKNSEYYNRDIKRNEGKVSIINSTKANSTKRNSFEGEYVDYEEIK